MMYLLILKTSRRNKVFEKELMPLIENKKTHNDGKRQIMILTHNRATSLVYLASYDTFYFLDYKMI